ncbi:MAG: UbiA family prenyltransferase [Saprospiraceae bacterium]|nr:UbiA family prenyltransferase [Saprospiraceae bacterium]
MKEYLSLIKFSHTVFALPFALIGFTLGILEKGTGLDIRLLVLVLLCMVFARSAAMAFNRYLDRDIDAVNPRTKVREIPAGVISPRSALMFVVLNCVAFIATTFFINPICFYLSPVALAVVLGYSYTKRFTWLCHVVLGAGLGLAPVGAWLAVTGYFAWTPVIYGLAVLCWVSGFDVIYALQDEDFDRSQRLYSMPAFFGKKQALRLSEWLHLFSAAFIVLAARLILGDDPQAGWLIWLATGFFLSMLVFQHRLVKPDDLSRVNVAFFTTNGIASVVYGVLVIGDLIF